MKSLILSFFKDESGATAIEYGLIAAGIAIAIITAVRVSAPQLSAKFGTDQHLAEVTRIIRQLPALCRRKNNSLIHSWDRARRGVRSFSFGSIANYRGANL